MKSNKGHCLIFFIIILYNTKIYKQVMLSLLSSNYIKEKNYETQSYPTWTQHQNNDTSQ